MRVFCIRNGVRLGFALIVALCLAGGAASRALGDSGRALVANDDTARKLVGNLRLLDDPVSKEIATVVFQNGRSVHLKPYNPDGTGSQGVYLVNPPVNPVLSNGKPLCSAGPATYFMFQFGIRSSATFDVYSGRRPPSQLTPRDHCGSFSYLESPRVTTLIANSKNSMSITGNVKLLAPSGSSDPTSIVFQNGSSVQISPKQQPSQGVYVVVPPKNPLLLHGNHLCRSNATFIALAFGIKSVVTMDVYTGKTLPGGPLDHCASYGYTQR
jgi:hypothetical protein